MMALLAGSGIAAHMLQLTNGSERLLPEMFPQIKYIEYFRLKTERATGLLVDNGHHLGAVAVPYALAVHEDFVTSCIDMLVSDFGRIRLAPGSKNNHALNQVKAWNMHEALEETLTGSTVNLQITTPMLELFHLLREMRNCHIHDGGTVSPALRLHVTSLSPPAQHEWLRLARRPAVDLLAAPAFRFTAFDIFTAFGVTKALGRAANTLINQSLTSPEWARLIVTDYAATTSKTKGSDQWMLGLLAFAKVTYGSTSITDADLLEECTRRQSWPSHRPLPQRVPRKPRNRGTQYPA